MPTIQYDQLGGAGSTMQDLYKTSGLVGYVPLNRVTAPVTFNPFTYGQATGDQPTEASFFQRGLGSTDMIYPGAENMPFSFQMKTNKGNDAGTFTVGPGQKVRIVDRKTGEVYYAGEGPLGGLEAAKVGQYISKEYGKKANWKIEVESNGQWIQGAQDKKAKKSFLGKIAGIALPAIGFALGGPLGAAAGGGLAGVAQGKGIGGILGNALLAGGTAFAGGQLGGLIQSGAGGTATALGNALGQGIANTGANVIRGQSLQDALLGGAISGIGSYGLSQLGESLGGRPANLLKDTPYADTVKSGLLGTGVSAGDLLKGLGAANLLIGQLGALPSGGGGGSASLPPSNAYSVTDNNIGGIVQAPIYTGPTDIYAAPASNVGRMKKGGKATHDNDDDEMMRHLMEYEERGGHAGPGRVKGIGSGQDDKIPAWLSDGEYVWGAQDVADLGDGSTDEGVRRLDAMRKMVRKQAGRKDVKKIAKPQKGIDHMLKAVGGPV